MKTKSKRMCRGCRNDYYNHGSNSQTGECWSFGNAQVVTRYRIGWWTQPTQTSAFREVVTLNCHHAPGQYGDYEQLPDFAVSPQLIASPAE